MKITVIGPYPPFRGGISDFNFSLSRELSKNHDLQLINFTTQYPNILFPGKTQYKSNDENDLQSERVLSSINPISWKKTANNIIEFDPDLVIIQYWMPFFSFSYSAVIKKIKKIKKIKVIAICHNIILHEDKGVYKYFTKRFLRRVDRFVVMSESVRNDLINIKPNATPKTLFHPIYELFGTEIDKNSAMEKLGIVSRNVILFFGLIREYKGLDILLKSIPIIINKLPDFKIVIAGECYENSQKYIDIIDELKLSDYIDIRMEFIPENEVVNYFSAADVVVLPYKTATQSGVTQIAYNFNRPVIISNVGGLSEIVVDGETGFVVKPHPEELAEAIIRFFDESKFNKFTDNIKEYKKRYSWNNFANQLMEFSKQ